MPDEELNENVEEEIDDSPVITVPIDTTLTHHGEAADAKAVGDALDLKADKGQVILAEEIPYVSGGVSVKEKLDEINAKTAEQIYVTDGENPQTIAEALENAAGSADQIPMADGETETIADRIGTIEDAITQAETDIGAVDTKIDTNTAVLGAQIASISSAQNTEFTDAQIAQIVAAAFGGE